MRDATCCAPVANSGESGAVEEQEVDAIALISDEHAGSRSKRLDREDLPAPLVRRGVVSSWALCEFAVRQWAGGVPVHEPGAIQHLSQRVDTTRLDHTDVGVPFAGASDRVAGKFEELAQGSNLRLDGRIGFGLSRQWIIGIERLRMGRRCEQKNRASRPASASEPADSCVLTSVSCAYHELSSRS